MPFESNLKQIAIRRPDDWHLHLRDGDILKGVVGHTSRVFGRAVIMPNLMPPITSVDAAIQYRERIIAAVPAADSFTPLMTAYLTDDFSPNELERGYKEGVFFAAKLYPANSTTNASEGVTDLNAIDSLLETMESIRMPLLIHGEVVDPSVDIFDREAVFIDRHLIPLLKKFPDLRVVLEHITTEHAVQFVESSSANIAATITPHHLHINRNAMFLGGLRSDFYCLPVAKRERHRLALRRAAISGEPCFFLGTDSAPHLRSSKESSCGCAGIFNAPFALESYAEAFDQEGMLDRLQAFASEFGALFYGLPFNKSSITLVRDSHIVPNILEVSGQNQSVERLVPFHAGDSLRWRVFYHENN